MDCLIKSVCGITSFRPADKDEYSIVKFQLSQILIVKIKS